jgi:hypothetical protein
MTIKLPPMPHGGTLIISEDVGSRAYGKHDMEAYAREAVRLNIAPLSDEPNWRHPKIQGLIGSEARLRIQIDLIWRILEDPNQEFGPSDMEYWDTLHDKLKSTLTAHGIKGD